MSRRAVLGILVLSLLAYANALGNEFTYDDFTYIAANDNIHLPLSQMIWAGYSPIGLWRPVAVISYAANYAISGSNPFSYHLFNILAHAAVCILLYRLLLDLLGRPTVACAAALLFAVHPLHTEAVTAAVGRMEVIAAGFVFAAWLLHWREKPYAAALCFFLGVATKETAVVFLALVLIGDWFLRKRVFPSRYLVYGLMLGLYLVMRWKTVGLIGLYGISPVMNPLAALPAYLRIANALPLAWMVLGLHFFPARLAADYSYDAIPVILNWGVLSAWIVATAALLAAWVWASRRSTAVFLGGAIYLTGFAATSNILIPAVNNFGERWAYLPSAGFCLLVALAVERLAQRSRTLAFVLLGLVVAAGLIRTVVRNADWKNNLTLFSSAVQVFPKNVRAHYLLGQAYLQRGDLPNAEQHLTAAARIFPALPDLDLALGSLAFKKGDYPAAEQRFLEALRGSTGNPLYSEVQVTYASFLMETGRYEPALALFDNVIAAQPGSSRAHSNRAVLYYRLKQPERARADAQIALRLNPANRQAAILEQRLAAGTP